MRLSLGSLSSLVPSQIFHVVWCCGPRVEQPRPQIEMQPPRLFPWSLSQLHPLFCREEGSMGCAKMPGYGEAPSHVHSSGLKVGICALASSPSPGPSILLTVRACHCHEDCHHSKLPMAGYSAQNDATDTWPSQRRIFVIPLKEDFQYKARVDNKTRKMCVHVAPKACAASPLSSPYSPM